MRKIALKFEVNGNTQGGKYVKKHALALLGRLHRDISIYLFK